MQIPVLIERVNANGYRAKGGPPFEITGEGSTREEALESLRQAINARLASGAELTLLTLPEPATPWREVAGVYKDDPLFDEWQQAIAEYREQVEKDPNSR